MIEMPVNKPKLRKVQIQGQYWLSCPVCGKETDCSYRLSELKDLRSSEPYKEFSRHECSGEKHGL